MKWLAVVLAIACSDPPPAPEPEPEPDPPAIAEPEPPIEPPPANVEPPPPPRFPSALGAPLALPATLPAQGCAFGDPQRVWEGSDGWAAIAANERVQVGGTVRSGAGEDVFAVVIDISPEGGTISLRVHERVDPPLPSGRRRAAPAMAASADQGFAMALVFGDRSLRLTDRSRAAFGWRTIAQGASERFSPALAHDGDDSILAWTDEREDPLRVRVAALSQGAAHELRAPNGNGTAPAFVAGASQPTLVFFDAREGMSVAHRVRIAGRALGEIEVAQPINLIASPPELAAAEVGGSTWLGYTAVGSLATTAVGLVRAGNDAPPLPLVRGTGYGTLHVHAASIGAGRAVFVADAPRGSAPDSQRELHVRTIDANGTLSEPAILRGPSGGASRGRIAYSTNGVVAVAFTDTDGVYAALGTCAP